MSFYKDFLILFLVSTGIGHKTHYFSHILQCCSTSFPSLSVMHCLFLGLNGPPSEKAQ